MPTQTGTTGADYLLGTAGADDLVGLAGDDVYIANNAGDRPIEIAGEGYDTVYAELDFKVPFGSSIELLAARDPVLLEHTSRRVGLHRPRRLGQVLEPRGSGNDHHSRDDDGDAPSLRASRR